MDDTFFFDVDQDLKDISNVTEINISELFYLSLLVTNENQLTIDYIYSINYIRSIYKFLLKYEKTIKNFKKIIISKIIICLISNYKISEEYNENEKEEILGMEEKINNIVFDKLIIFKNELDIQYNYDEDFLKKN